MSVTLTNVVKRFISPDGGALDIVDVPALQLADREQAALVGSSGSGKTTLLHLIAGILAPDSGSIQFNLGPGPIIDIAGISEPRRDLFRGKNLGYIFQTHHLLGGFTAMENVLLGMSFTGRPADKAWARHLLSEVGLSHRENYRPSKLSVGQQQRVAVARALANRPKVVLADEPTGSLDAANAVQVLELIRSLCREVSATLLLVTHDAAVAAQMDRTLKLSDINRAARAAAAVP